MRRNLGRKCGCRRGKMVCRCGETGLQPNAMAIASHVLYTPLYLCRIAVTKPPSENAKDAVFFAFLVRALIRLASMPGHVVACCMMIQRPIYANVCSLLASSAFYVTVYLVFDTRCQGSFHFVLYSCLHHVYTCDYAHIYARL